MAKVELDIRAQIANLNKGLDKTQKELKGLQKQSTKTSRTIQKNMSGTTNAVTKLTSAMGALLTVGAAVQFTKAIINVRAEFEKFRAVLTNTLGSAQAANREFAKIQKFAADTPFAVRELTDSFVRLVNQGFKPTMNQMRQLGDLAASTGKGFIQLTEAIIDAQTGEFERLKDFGIKASKQGDQVTFSFKEVKTQVEFTASAIQGYILSLGDLEGVAGATVAISKTLGGQINNLTDSWDALLDEMGGRSKGVFVGVIRFFDELLFRVKDLIVVTDPETGATAALENLKEILSEIADDKRAGAVVQVIIGLREEIKKVTAEIDKLSIETIYGTPEEAEAFREQLRMQVELYTELLLQINMGTDDIESLNDAEEAEIETLETLSKKLKKLQTDKKELNVLDTEGLITKNREIFLLQKQIKELERLGLAYKKLAEDKEEDIKLEDWMTDATEKNTDTTWENVGAKVDFEKMSQEDFEAETGRIRTEEEQRVFAETKKRLAIEGTGEAVLAGLNLMAVANKDNAELQQAIAISEAIINGALAITKIQSQMGAFALPFQIAAGLTTLAQIAVIRQQKFERGGYDVLGGRRHAQGGVDIGIGEAEAGEGVAVFSRQATKKYGKFLPAFVKAINENKTDVVEGNTYSFNYDDSRSVSKLEDIRKLLSKPDIRIEKGYKILTRNGQTTRIKLTY